VSVSGHRDQLGVDPDLVAGTQDAALHHGVDTQFMSDFG
jgi:hypothetical protein